ncbi:hypothetical protein [Rhodoplanes sp. Z2-YC6860]|uniref:hypothetical protein n=1 Tax=Rhodoplanes sp. Z2-YC6860 TaxID=674703 RepID=UPI0012ECFE4E|nr:hypothetical protein [Rhodoplanes sp. Z2-YC6860]
MRKLFMAAAALTIAAATAPGFATTSQAASVKKSPYCDLAKFQRNAPSWDEHYGCLGTASKQARVRERAPRRVAATTRGKSEFCDLAKFQRNAPSWNEHYGCLGTPQRQAFAQETAPAQVSATARGKSEFCDLAKFQRNAPSWNEHYGCLNRR